MRLALFLPLSLCAAPALAQAAPPASPNAIELPPQLATPATADRVADTMQALSQAFLDLPVGQLQAAIEGRKPTSADRHRTVGSETGLKAHDLQQRIAAAKPQIEQSIKALNEALPEVTANLQQAQRAVARAIANMPDPNYPRR